MQPQPAAVLFALSLLAAATCGRAQDLAPVNFDFAEVQIVEAGFVVPAQSTLNQAGAEQQRQRMQHYLLVRVEHISRVCDLNDRQMKKLKVAAKRAAQLALENGQQRAAMQAPKLPGGAGFVDPRFAQQVAGGLVAQRVNVPRPQAAAVLNMQPVGNNVIVEQLGFRSESADAAAAEQPIWQQTVRRVLTPQQQVKYEAAQQRLAQRAAERPVDKIVLQIDQQLFLSAEQRARFAELISSAMRRPVARFGLPHAYQLVPESALQRILSDAQLGRWRDLKQAAGNGNRVLLLDDGRLRRIEEPAVIRGGFFRPPVRQERK